MPAECDALQDVDPELEMLGASASSAFGALFCALSAQPSVVVGVHLSFVSLKMAG